MQCIYLDVISSHITFSKLYMTCTKYLMVSEQIIDEMIIENTCSLIHKFYVSIYFARSERNIVKRVPILTYQESTIPPDCEFS